MSENVTASDSPGQQTLLLEAFAAAVRASPHNLLSRRALDELETRHLPECEAFARTLPHGADVLDLGSGGGFPGMVVAIVRPDLRVTLLDATGKKILFLREFAERHGLQVATLRGRAEELQGIHAASFDVVTARAVAPLVQLVPWAIPFLRPGGTLHAIKGERWRAELQEALPIIARAGAGVVGVPGHTVDDDDPHTPDQAGDAMPRVVIIRAAG